MTKRGMPIKYCEKCHVVIHAAKHQCEHCGYITDAGVAAMKRERDKRK